MKNAEQQKYLKELIELMQSNPELPVYPMVNGEIVASDEYSSWLGSWGKPTLDETWSDDERIFFKSEDMEDLIDNVAESFDGDIDDDEAVARADEIVNKYEWQKVILVRIGLPC